MIRNIENIKFISSGYISAQLPAPITLFTLAFPPSAFLWLQLRSVVTFHLSCSKWPESCFPRRTASQPASRRSCASRSKSAKGLSRLIERPVRLTQTGGSAGHTRHYTQHGAEVLTSFLVGISRARAYCAGEWEAMRHPHARYCGASRVLVLLPGSTDCHIKEVCVWRRLTAGEKRCQLYSGLGKETVLLFIYLFIYLFIFCFWFWFVKH